MSAEPNQPVLDETSSSVSTTVPDEKRQDPDTISGAACLEKADNVEKTEQENTSAESGTATENHVLEPNPPVVDETSSTSVTVPEEQKQDPGTISVEKADNAEETEQENTASAASETATENNALEQSQDTPQDNIPSKASLRSPDDNPDETSRENASASASTTEYATAAELNLEEVTLYHYTTTEGAIGINRDMRVRKDHPAPWTRRHRHGTGVYFTRLDHYTPQRTLIKNNFVNQGQYLRDEFRFIDRIMYVVKITFYKRDVEEISDGSRDLWVHHEDIDLNDYIGSPIIDIPPENISVLSGANVTFYCQALGSPDPIIEWWKNGRVVAKQKGNSRVRDSYTMINVQPSDAGKITCKASNNKGKVIKDAFLSVDGQTGVYKLIAKVKKSEGSPLSTGAIVAIVVILTLIILIILGVVLYRYCTGQIGRRSDTSCVRYELGSDSGKPDRLTAFKYRLRPTSKGVREPMDIYDDIKPFADHDTL